MDKFIDENLAEGYIWPSKSPMASPFFFAAKKSRDLWPCQDYQQLNEGTIMNSYPLPLISDLVDQLKGAKYFTKLDVQWGYNNVRIKDGDQWKAAFKTSQGLFEPTVMFFGMCNSPATFQAMMDSVFQDMKAEGWIIINMDNIFIFTKELQWNIEYTKQTLQQLQKNNLYLKLEKCTFWTTKVEYLGLIIQENHISMNPVKLNRIKDWPVPTTVKQVQSFLGFGNYYQWFIHGYGNLTQPLNDLLRKDEKFEWTPEWQDAFDILKQHFIESPVLLMPDLSKPFILEMDASLFASRAVLWQQDSNGDWHPCAYLSKSFNDTECNYNIWDRELLAVIRALTEWWHYLQGSLLTITLLSDHQNLAYYNNLTSNRLDGACCLLNMTWNLYTYLEQKWSNLTHSDNDRISALKITRITLTRPSYQMASLLTLLSTSHCPTCSTWSLQGISLAEFPAKFPVLVQAVS